jgi:cell division protein FtsL
MSTKQEKRRQLRLSFGFGPLLMVIIFTVVTAAMGSFLVHSQYEVVRMGYIIDQDLTEYRRQLETVKRLELSIASYKHPKSVTALAEQELDMRTPEYTEEFMVPDPSDQKVNVRSPDLEPANAPTAPGGERP